jgi:hypothetical protein
MQLGGGPKSRVEAAWGYNGAGAQRELWAVRVSSRQRASVRQSATFERGTHVLGVGTCTLQLMLAKEDRWCGIQYASFRLGRRLMHGFLNYSCWQKGVSL